MHLILFFVGAIFALLIAIWIVSIVLEYWLHILGAIAAVLTLVLIANLGGPSPAQRLAERQATKVEAPNAPRGVQKPTQEARERMRKMKVANKN